MNKYLTILMVLFFSSMTHAQLVGSAFNYQGQLIDDGNAANGQYDIIIDAFNDEFGNNLLGSFTVNNIIVVDGIFTIPDVDFGAVLLGNVTWLEISVKESINGINFETLSPRQRINAVPYAYESEFANTAAIAQLALTANEAVGLASNGANNNDVLTYNGSQWIPRASNWQQQNNALFTTNTFSDYQVAIGTSTPNSGIKFTVNSGGEDGIITQFVGGGDMFNEYLEGTDSRGYIGSVVNGSLNPGTADSDFEIGTSSTNNSGKMHITTQAIPRITVLNNGNIGIGNTSPTEEFQIGTNDLTVSNRNIGIGTTSPTALLEVDASNRQVGAGGNLFRAINTNNQNVFLITSSGVTYVGGFKLGVPNNSLYVKGDTWQDLSSNGLMKFMARVDCNVNNGPIAPTNLIQSFNGVDNLQIEYISPASGFGNCIVDFKHDISSRYWQVTAVGSNGDRVANCDLVPGNNNQLLCQQKLIVSGSQASGHIMILVY